MMISEPMNQKLNEQIAKEFSASHKYLAMACDLDDKGLKILSKFFARQCDEEREHALKLLHYVLEVGGTVELQGVVKPPQTFSTVEEIVQAALASEIEITKSINDIVALAETEKDYASRSFLGWFVDEQVEEVATMRDLVQLVQLAKGDMLQVEARVRHEMMDEAKKHGHD
ncbi:MAG: ferritin [Phycisphaerae bacterium]